MSITEGITKRPFIFVLAGVNGAGKSSMGGTLLLEHGLDWFNPDTYARDLRAQFNLDSAQSNSRAWEHNRSRLEDALIQKTSYAFETTLGGRSIPDMLSKASRSHDIMMLFCGLSTVELHLKRVQLRVEHGGHAIPEDKIRERWISSRTNLIKLLPQLTRLQIFDNSAEAMPNQEIPDLVRVLDMIGSQMVYPDPRNPDALKATPEWARPIVQAAIESTYK